MTQSAILTATDDAPPIDLRNFLWVAFALAALAAAIAIDNVWLLNFFHVMAGVLWTGIDLFMGFVVGPILRSAPFLARRAIVIRLMPKTLFLLPTLAIITGTAGAASNLPHGLSRDAQSQSGWCAHRPADATLCLCRRVPRDAAGRHHRRDGALRDGALTALCRIYCSSSRYGRWSFATPTASSALLSRISR